MLIDLDKIPAERIAALDSSGNKVSYGDICTLSAAVKQSVGERSLCFMLVENTAGALAWVMASLASETLVPLILNVKTEAGLLQSLIFVFQKLLRWNRLLTATK